MVHRAAGVCGRSVLILERGRTRSAVCGEGIILFVSLRFGEKGFSEEKNKTRKEERRIEGRTINHLQSTESGQ
jgi:hypothetical protein